MTGFKSLSKHTSCGRTLLLVGSGILLIPFGAVAGAHCSQVVLDNAKQLSPRDVKALEDSAADLKAKGADVHLVTLAIPAESGIDSALLRVVGSCPEWQSTSSEAYA